MEKAKRCFSRRLFSEKGHSNRTGACMGANDASNAHIANIIKESTPKITAVLNVLLQQNIRQAGIAKEYRFCKVDPADFLNLLGEKIIPHFGAAGLAKKLDLTINDGDNGLDVFNRPPAKAAALEIRPPRLRYSSVSRTAITTIFFLSS